MVMNYQHISIARSIVLGSQIDYQTAYKELNVSFYDINDEAIQKARERIMKLKSRYQEDLEASNEKVGAAYNRISFYSDLAEGVKEADFVIEAIPEVAQITTDFYREIGKAAPRKTNFATSSS